MTNRCPITYEKISDNALYSRSGLRQLSTQLTTLDLIPFTAKELISEAYKRADKLSIQGVQPKLSAKLDIKNHCFHVVDKGGDYIFKPQNPMYDQAPENEDLSMRLASVAGIDAPFHGLLYNKEKQFVYAIKRFDRAGRGKKIAIEDFAQLSGNNRDTKYDFSMERLIPIIDKYTTFPAIERAELFLRTLVNYLIGNEDMHLKNYSLIKHKQKICLAPAYDFINSTIILSKAKEEIALPLNGKKRNLTRKDLIDYFGSDRLALSDKVIQNQLTKTTQAIPKWYTLIEQSFLSDENKVRYRELVEKRAKVLGFK